MLFQWGALQFDITPFNVHEADQMTATDWARKEIAGAAIYREWVGEGDEEIALRGRVFPHRLGGLTELEVLESFRRQGKAELLMRGDGAVLLRRRPESGLLGGMIEVPSTPWREAEWSEAEALGSAPASTQWTALPGMVQHGFTHFRLDLTILTATTSDPPEGIWARPEQFKDYAFPTLTKKIAKHALSVLG